MEPSKFSKEKVNIFTLMHRTVSQEKNYVQVDMFLTKFTVDFLTLNVDLVLSTCGSWNTTQAGSPVFFSLCDVSLAKRVKCYTDAVCDVQVGVTSVM